MTVLPGLSKSFERYYKLIEKISTGVKALYVFDEDKNVIWRSRPGSVNFLSDIRESLTNFSEQLPLFFWVQYTMGSNNLPIIRI